MADRAQPPLPRADFEAAGPFDERFRSTCEDQDLAERARARGIRFLYDSSIDCLHNDQAGDLGGGCRAQRRGTHDTALFCAKYPERHGGSPLRARQRVLEPAGRRAALREEGREVDPRAEPLLRVLEGSVPLLERTGLPGAAAAARLTAGLIGLYTFRGWRAGPGDAGAQGPRDARGLGRDPRLQPRALPARRHRERARPDAPRPRCTVVDDGSTDGTARAPSASRAASASCTRPTAASPPRATAGAARSGWRRAGVPGRGRRLAAAQAGGAGGAPARAAWPRPRAPAATRRSTATTARCACA